jgi:proliferating cell nuclear antigen
MAIAVAVPESMPEPEDAGEYEAGIAEDDAEAEVLEGEPTDNENGEVEEEVGPEPEVPEEPEPPRPPVPHPGLEAWVETKALKTFLAQVEAIADEARVISDLDGWHVKAVDPAHVAMIEVTLPFAAFSRNRTFWAENPPSDGPEKPEIVEFGIDVEKLVKKLKSVKADEVGLIYTENDTRGNIRLTFGSRQDDIGTIDTAGMSDPKVPTMTFNTEFKISAKMLRRVVDAAGEISDHVTLTTETDEEGRNRLVATAEGDVDKYREVFLEEVEWVRGQGGPQKSIFPLDYLDSFLKPVKDEILTVQMGTDYPLRIDWSGVTKGTYLCAPRIESDG